MIIMINGLSTTTTIWTQLLTVLFKFVQTCQYTTMANKLITHKKKFTGPEIKKTAKKPIFNCYLFIKKKILQFFYHHHIIQICIYIQQSINFVIKPGNKKKWDVIINQLSLWLCVGVCKWTNYYNERLGSIQFKKKIK